MFKKWTLAIVISAICLIVATALAVNQKQNSKQVSQNREITPEKSVSETNRESSCCGGQSSGCAVRTGSKAASCCDGQGNGNTTKPLKMLEALENYLYRVYAEKLQDPQITVKVQDLGCHMEAEIKKGEQVVKRLSINGNTITELS